MKFHVMTLFPEMIQNGLNTSILGKAAEKGLISFEAVNMRDYTLDKHGKVDDYPYGGGAGMLIQAQPVYDTYQAITASMEKKPRTIYLTPQGRRFDQKMAHELAGEDELVFVCGHYEGIDERVLEEIVTDYVSIGDYVLTGGELPVMVMIDAISRLVPGVLNNDISAETETFHNDLLEYPQYTRPETWREKKVPEVLLSGHAKKINAWRLEQSIAKTKERRPDLYMSYQCKQEIIKRLSKKKRKYIHMMELVNRGLGEVVYEQDMDILLKYEGIYMINAVSGEAADKMLQNVDLSDAEIVTAQEEVCELLTLKYGMQKTFACKQAVFTRKEALPVRYKTIKQLNLTHLYYITEHYEDTSEEYIMERLTAGVMYGAFDEDRLVGFIGLHKEGSMGMLFVEEEYRRKGIAASLESFLINLQLSNGQTPYCQIKEDNEHSLALQEKLGLYISKQTIWWLG